MEDLEKTTDLGQSTTTLPYVDARDRIWAAVVTRKGFTPALSSPLAKCVTKTNRGPVAHGP